MVRPALIVHGGAGDIPLAEHAAYEAGTRRAAQVAWQLLENGAYALYAVEMAVRVLEDDPTFDSGRGSVLNALGEIELDALIMDGQTLDLGAVIASPPIANPITLARLIMTDSPHNVLAGEGARQFALRMGIPSITTADLATPHTLARFHARQSTDQQAGEPTSPSPKGTGTCGAVALDQHGHVAAATSTGGTPLKLPGRVGDSPLVGSGAYADDRSGAASATGEGESIMRVVLSKTATDAIEHGLSAQAAADFAIRVLVDRVSGQGGVILVDREGQIGYSHSTPHISVAWVAPDGSIHTAMQ